MRRNFRKTADSRGFVARLRSRSASLPFANEEVLANLMKQGERAIRRYLKEHGNQLKSLEHAEKIIELKLSDGIVVSGRIDLIRRTDTNEVAIVDFKSDDNTQPKEMTRLQLHVYAAGYRKATGKGADLLEIHNLEQGHIHREEVEESTIETSLAQIVNAGKKIRDNELPKHPAWCETCVSCDMAGICRKKPGTSNTRLANALPAHSLVEAG
ncbi:MAG: RecB family exonuclease [Bradyrhizobium sp.]